MKLRVVSFGHKRDELYQPALTEYASRLVKPWLLTLEDLPTGRKSESESAEAVMRRELQTLEDKVTLEKACLLDVEGKAHSTETFAAWLQRCQDSGEKDLVFVIGGADGVHKDGRARAAHKLSLSKLTLPHRLARVLLAEQIYRAQSILRGEKYHR